jgi:predicted CXXCH cytochrome family protein
MKHSLIAAGIVITFLFQTWQVQAQEGREAATAAFKDDVHATVGLTCGACHPTSAGGDERYAAIARTAIAPLCAKCHSDAAYMRGFDPQVRIDQFAQYLTSTHGKHMAAGDVRVATCSDCHTAHGIRRVRDPRSPVAPLNVATTCARCHGDAARMAPFGRSADPPVDWSASVHAAALLQRGDTSAPTCSSCHGSHGATPPGVANVANVCAQCHVRQAELFRASPKKEIFDAMGQAECLACHSNHRIESPADTWIGLQEGTVCVQCHDDSTGGAQTIRDFRQQLDRLSTDVASAEAVLTRAEQAGMLVDEGQLALREARDHQLHSRVLVHAFAPQPLADTVAEGLMAAGRAQQAGDAAMSELEVRRRGLAVATLLVLAFLVSLWLKIRRLPDVHSGA